MKCRVCREPAIIDIRRHNANFCSDHFLRLVRDQTTKAIDEFQMMFADNDRLSAEIAVLLVQGARLFRACGIHIVLASQTIGGNVSLMGSAGEGLFGQFPVRIALKNSLSESHATLGSRNDAAAHLRAREAIVNVDYGQLSANRKTTIAFADWSRAKPYAAQNAAVSASAGSHGTTVYG